MKPQSALLIRIYPGSEFVIHQIRYLQLAKQVHGTDEIYQSQDWTKLLKKRTDVTSRDIHCLAQKSTKFPAAGM